MVDVEVHTDKFIILRFGEGSMMGTAIIVKCGRARNCEEGKLERIVLSMSDLIAVRTNSDILRHIVEWCGLV